MWVIISTVRVVWGRNEFRVQSEAQIFSFVYFFFCFMKTDCFVGDNIHYAYLPALVSTNMFATGDEIKLHSTYIYSLRVL
jgi:hypothetical protein